MEIFKTYVRLDQRLYLKCKKHIAKHRRLALFEHLIDSVEADSTFPERLKEHDNFFKPANEYEKRLWDSCRELAKEDIETLKKKVNGGKKSAEIRKQKKEPPAPVVQQVPQPKEEKPIRGSFVAPTEEEFLKMAQEWDKSAGTGGFSCSRQQAIDFWLNYDSQNWIKANGQHITNIKSAFRQWILRKEKDDLPKLI